jgi:hypothetical protein
LAPPDIVFLHESEAAVGLEHVAKLLSEDDAASISAKSFRSRLTTRTRPSSPDSDIIKEDPTSELSGADGEDSYSVLSISKKDIPAIHYGSISDKIGEAAVSWLARWGTDILKHELGSSSAGSIPFRRRAATVSEVTPRDNGSKAGGDRQTQLPAIWRHGGLPADWVKAIISSDYFFVKGERERYNFAKSVVELRRQAGVLPEEEKHWEELFDHGIYYSNMVGYRS